MQGKNRKIVLWGAVALIVVLAALAFWLRLRSGIDSAEETIIEKQTRELKEKMEKFTPLTEEETEAQTEQLEEIMRRFEPLTEEEIEAQTRALEERMGR